jgi:SAM-dependent methyltransferase
MDLTEVPEPGTSAGSPFRRHPWELARARFFARVVGKAGGLSTARRVLDVGAGDGFLARALLQQMSPGGQVVCVDTHYSDQDLRRFGDPPVAGLSFTRVRPAGAFDLVLLLDVVEHIEDDRGFLAEIVSQSLAPAGMVLVSVPAWQFLYSQHDVELKHFRRYSPGQCRRLLEGSGLRILRSGGLFHSLLLPRLIQRLREGKVTAGKSAGSKPADLGDWRGGPLVSSAVGMALLVDNQVSHLMALLGTQAPGLSYWALCARAG